MQTTTAAAPSIGREQEIEVGGRTWKLARWEYSIWLDFLAWARTRLPDPIEVTLRHVEKLPTALAEKLVSQAMEKSLVYLTIGSPEVNQLLASMEGSIRLIWLLLKIYQPTCTEQDAFEFTQGVQLQDETDRAARLLALEAQYVAGRLTTGDLERRKAEITSEPPLLARLLEVASGRERPRGNAAAPAA